MGDRRGCATGTYRTPTALGHASKAGSHSIHRNKHREAAKIRRQRSMAQMKEMIKTPENGINKMEISNHSDAEFKTLFIRMLKELVKTSAA